MSAHVFADRVGVDAGRPRGGEEHRKAFEHHVGGVLAGLGQRPFAEYARRDVGAAQLDVDRLLDIVGMAFLDDEHGALTNAERAQLLRHQRIDDVEHQQRHPRRAENIGEAEPLQRAQQAVGQPAHDDDADLVEIAGNHLVELALADEGLRRRHPALDLEPLVHEGHRRMGEPRVIETRRPGEEALSRIGAGAVVLRREGAGDVAGADAKLQHDRGTRHRRQTRARSLSQGRSSPRGTGGSFVSDSGHHRVLVLDHDGKVLDTIGSGFKGTREGDFAEASFDDPEGLALDGDQLYIADTRGYVIERADLKSRKVTRLAGTGVLGAGPLGDAAPALQTALRFSVGTAPRRTQAVLHCRRLAPDRSDSLDAGTVARFAGSGRENIKDGAADNGQLRAALRPHPARQHALLGGQRDLVRAGDSMSRPARRRR